MLWESLERQTLLSSQWQQEGLRGDRLKRPPEERPAPKSVLLDLETPVTDGPADL